MPELTAARRRQGAALFACSLFALLLALPLSSAAGALYHVTSLSPLTFVNGINNKGQIVGSNDNHAFLYQAGVLTDLGTFPGGVDSFASGINDNGQVVGGADGPPITQHAFLYSNGAMIDAGSLGGTVLYDGFFPTTISAGRAINNLGQIVGESAYGPHGADHAFLYSGGVMTDLGTLASSSQSRAWGINDHGEIVGDSGGFGHAFLYSGGMMTDLGTLGGENSIAQGINNNGQIVGWANNAAGSGHGFLYSEGVMTDIGSLPGGGQSGAYAINNNGEIVGTAAIVPDGQPVYVGEWHAILYSGGAMIDLNTRLDTSSAGWLLEDAVAINDVGMIVGDGLFNGGTSSIPVLLTPVPEPSALVLLAIGGLALGGLVVVRKRERRRRPS